MDIRLIILLLKFFSRIDAANVPEEVESVATSRDGDRRAT
jgi:hypothetical protein